MHEFHEFASMFPLLEGEEFDQLVADIKEHGQREPIVMLNDMVLDGRNRYLACRRLGIAPRMRDFNCIDGDPLNYIWSQNVSRRHLTEAQRAMAIAKRVKFLEKGRVEPQRETMVGQLADQVDTAPISEAQAAEIANVSVRSIGRAKQVLNYGTKEDIDAVARGKMKLWPASEKARTRKHKEIEEQGIVTINRGGFMRIAIPDGYTPESYTRYGLELEEKEGADPSKLGKRLNIADDSYRKMREIVLISDRTDLPKKERKAAALALKTLNETRQVSNSYPIIEGISRRIWGLRPGSGKNTSLEARRVAEFEKQIEIISHICETEIEIPQLSAEQVSYTTEKLEASLKGLRKLLHQLKDIYDE